MILMTMDNIIRDIVGICKYPFGSHCCNHLPFVTNINSIINLLRHKDKQRGRKLLEIANFIKSNCSRMTIIIDPRHHDIHKGKLPPITFGCHKPINQNVIDTVRIWCNEYRHELLTPEFVNPTVLYENINHHDRVARASAVQMTDRPDDEDNEGRNVNNVMKVDDEAQTPLNLDEIFSAYATLSTINNPEQNVA
jgi:hypothetical protein